MIAFRGLVTIIENVSGITFQGINYDKALARVLGTRGMNIHGFLHLLIKII